MSRVQQALSSPVLSKNKEWDLNWIRCTLELKSMKQDGNEGQDVAFRIAKGDKVPAVKGSDRNIMTFYDWNIAGWDNARSVLRKRAKGDGSNVFETQVGQTVENNKWDAIKIEISPDKVIGYLYGEKGVEVKEGLAEGRTEFSLFGTAVDFDNVVVYDKDGLTVDLSEKLATFWGQIRRQK